MKEIIAATNNKNKLREIREILNDITVYSLDDVGIICEPEENGATFEENALIKARAVYALAQKPVIADDSGIIANALHDRPGVYSARFAGTHGDDRANNQKLLDMLEGETDRTAYFMSAVALICKEGEFVASGKTEGEILTTPLGENGFGYDPLFYSYELSRGFGESTAQQKNSVSHRAKALKNLLQIIKDNNIL